MQDGYTDGTAGCLSYWRIVKEDEDERCLHGSKVHLEQVEQETPVDPGIDSSDKSLTSVFTAWDAHRDHCAQVFFWKGEDYSVLQFRYGGQNCIVEKGRFAALVGACFRGLNIGNYAETTGDGAAISAVFASTVYFYEPFGFGERKVS